MGILKNKLIITLMTLLMVVGVSFLLIPVKENKPFHQLSKAEKSIIKKKNKKARGDYFFNITKDPATNKIPDNMRAKELKFANDLQKKSSSRLNKENSTTLDWKDAGPTDIGGRTRALAVDLTNSNIILAGGVNGGIWKSTNKGNTWVLKSDPSTDLSVSYICQDPNNTNVWYYSAGEMDQSAVDRGWTARMYGSGIYKSTNSGESWFRIVSEGTLQTFDSPTDYISKIMVSKTSGSVFFAGSMFGIYKSTDNGASFNKVFGGTPAGSVRYYEFDIAENGTIIASTSYKENASSSIDGGVYISTDDGVTWNENTPAEYDNYGGWRRSVVAFAPSDNSVAYVWTDAVDGNGDPEPAFHKLNITGNSATSVDRSNNLPQFGGNVGDINTQGSYNMILEVKPDDPDFVLFGATNLYRSFDGFATPANNKAENWIGGYATSNDISQYENQHPDQHALFFDPANPDALWSGHDGGLSYIADINQVSNSISWVDKNSGYNVTQFYKIDMGTLSGSFYLGGGAQDNGSPFFAYSNGTAQTSSDLSSGDGAFIYFGSTFVVASSQEGYVSKLYPNGTWFVVSPLTVNDRQFLHPYLLDPADENVMYYADGTNLLRNTQIGSITNQNFDGTDEGWSNLGDIANTFNVDNISAFGAGSDHTLYVGMSGSGKPELVKITNANTSTSGFQDVSVSDAASGAYLHDIAVNPANSDELLVIFSNYNIVSVFHSSNGGSSYTSVEGNLSGSTGPSVRGAEIVTHNGVTKYYLATSTGVYSVDNLNGSSTEWIKEGVGTIGNVVTNDIVSVPATGEIAVGTHGRGIFYASSDNILSMHDNSVPETFNLEQNYPNPFNPSTTIAYQIPESIAGANVNLSIYDILGNHITTLVDESKSAGNYTVSFTASSLTSGVYLYTITSGSYSMSKKMILMK
ncbi:MAG: hypothetical protein SCALA702_32090 [Melioribacteraceae bacterium]|nr:MAG: hypothetical protein SCALA702_32090 [Melioribacteraceae bacterium]